MRCSSLSRPRFALAASVAVALAACAPAPLPEQGSYIPVELPACAPNLDGRIDAEELPFVIGATARVRVAADVAVDVAGAPGQSSARVWDLTRPDPADEALGLLTTEPIPSLDAGTTRGGSYSGTSSVFAGATGVAFRLTDVTHAECDGSNQEAQLDTPFCP